VGVSSLQARPTWFSDRLTTSIIDVGCLGDRRVFDHDAGRSPSAAAAFWFKRCLVVTESYFSMDGVAPPRGLA
jgi:hypothetical protein